MRKALIGGSRRSGCLIMVAATTYISLASGAPANEYPEAIQIKYGSTQTVPQSPAAIYQSFYGHDGPSGLKVKLFPSTFSHAYSNPKPGVKCQKARILVRSEAKSSGTIELKLVTKIGNKSSKKETLVHKLNPSSAGAHKAETKKWISVTKPTVLQVAVTSAKRSPRPKKYIIKKIALNCTGSAGGGWASPSSFGEEMSHLLNTSNPIKL